MSTLTDVFTLSLLTLGPKSFCFLRKLTRLWFSFGSRGLPVDVTSCLTSCSLLRRMDVWLEVVRGRAPYCCWINKINQKLQKTPVVHIYCLNYPILKLTSLTLNQKNLNIAHSPSLKHRCSHSLKHTPFFFFTFAF